MAVCRYSNEDGVKTSLLLHNQKGPSPFAWRIITKILFPFHHDSHFSCHSFTAMFNKPSFISSLLLTLALTNSFPGPAFATPAPLIPPTVFESRSSGAGISIPIRKRSGLANSSGVFDVDKARVDVIMTVNKHRRNMMNYLSTQGSLPAVS